MIININTPKINRIHSKFLNNLKIYIYNKKNHTLKNKM